MYTVTSCITKSQLTHFHRRQIRLCISPCASLLPGHFCLAAVDALVAGHVMFHISSDPKGHPPKV